MIKKEEERKCAICGEEDSRALKEYHHIYGLANSPDTILLCYNCHTKITQDQNLLAPKVRRRRSGKANMKNFEDVSMGSLLELIGGQLKKRGLGKHGDNCPRL
jgi:hypothetical protein